MLVYLKNATRITFAILILGLIFAFSTFWYFSSDLPDYKILSNYKPPVSSRVHSGEGQLIAEYALQKRLFIPYDSIPKKVINSFLSAEDKNFFSHPGIDAKSITRAIIKNIQNIFSNKRLEGASTITQQVAKNFLLTNEVSIKRKIKEAILAFRIERAYSKQRIMELYLNQIYLGQGTYGIAAASLEYFDKAVGELQYEEAALLAALPKAPSKYNPYKSEKIAELRRNIVLKNLYENGYLKQTEYKNLVKKEIKLKKRKIKLLEEANFYSEEVRRIVSDTYGYDNLYKGGLSIRTPLNSYYQIEALKALRLGLEQYDRRHGWRGALKNVTNKNWERKVEDLILDKSLSWKLAKVIKIEKLLVKIQTIDNETGYIDFKNASWTRKKSFEEILKLNDIIYVKNIKKNKWSLKQMPKVNGSIVVMDPYTGRVLAMVGGFSFKLSEFNRATQARRQPGSAFKPFVYAAALESGFTPSTLVLDAPFVMDQGEGLKTWKPENYGKRFYGPSTLRTGIEKSRNLMTVRIAEKVGFKKISEITNNFGIYKDIKGFLIFNFIYVFIAILTFIFWNYFSALSLFLFLLISAYHFSEDWKNNMNIFNRLIIGFSIINLPLFFHKADVLQIYNYITDDLVMQDYINLIINIIYVNIILLVLVALKNIKNFNILIQIITILVSSYALNPLYFFMCYFCFFHSLKNYKESVSFLNNEKKSKINIIVLLNIIITIMMGIIYFYYFIGSYSPANISKLIFIGLAALTVPHMILKFIISYKT